MSNEQAFRISSPREAREAAGLTQVELAHRSGLDPSTIFRIERSGAWPTRVRTLRALRIALGLDAAPADDAAEPLRPEAACGGMRAEVLAEMDRMRDRLAARRARLMAHDGPEMGRVEA